MLTEESRLPGMLNCHLAPESERQDDERESGQERVFADTSFTPNNLCDLEDATAPCGASLLSVVT